MGANQTKQTCINYEDAVKRVTDSELKRIKETFKRSSGSSGTILSKNAFLSEGLPEGIPSALADSLYSACGGTQKGISFKDVLCGLVLLTKGTQDEKIKFLWNIYCNDSNTHIVKQEFAKQLQIETVNQPPTSSSSSVSSSSSLGYQNALNVENHTYGGGGGSGSGGISDIDCASLTQKSVLISLFGQSDRVTFEQFKSWILSHKKDTILSKWLLLGPGVNLSCSDLETPTFYQSLAGVTHLEEKDIEELEKTFWALKGAAFTKQLDLESLRPLITPPVPHTALPGVFLAFDENRDGHIDFKELCCGVSAACRGPSVERSKFCFKVFDIDRDGILNFDEIKEMINILIFVAKESSNSINYKNINYDKVLLELYGRIQKQNQIGDPTSISSKPKTTTDHIQPFTFSQEDFMMWSVQSSLNLVQPFLDLLFEVCHIVLGLRPQCKHLEYNIVKGWLSRERSRGYRIGQFWYLISSEWYNNWVQYTQSTSTTTPCTICKSTSNYNNSIRNVNMQIDEAMVCDESFTSNSTESMGDLLGNNGGDSSSLGSGSSGISCGRNLGGTPGTIDNTNLVAPNSFKNVPTLTGEGGRLKKDVLLVEHQDYEIVPESLWKALYQWYNSTLPLPRQVIQPTSSPDVELEMYPLNLRILKHQIPPPVAQSVSTWGAVAGGYGAITSASNYSTTNSMPSVLHTPKRYLAYTAAFSRLATVKQVAEFLCQRLKLKLEDVRLWHTYSLSENSCLLEDDFLTLQELSISDNDQILLEIRNKDLTWPEELGSLTLSSPSFSNLDRRPTIASIQSVSAHPPGATGLHNLGNTCFMNAALQVLFNTQPLTQYFKEDMYRFELNITNKLGTKGQLAIRYSELLKEVWTAQTRSVAPLKLRFCVTKHAPQFAGGGQHDSQELLEWFLDALHEDLNRVTEKSYSELRDSNGRPDELVATEAWAQHHARNQSIIIDLFYGQLKSKVSCLHCGRDSVRFDPFSLLSLPLPVENYTYCEVLVILLDGSIPVKYGLRLNSDSNYSDLKKELSTLCNLETNMMLVCELSSNAQIRCSLPDDKKLKDTTATELFVYEIPKGGFWHIRTGSDLSRNIEKGLKDIQRNTVLQLMSAEHNQLTTTSTMSTLTISSDDGYGVIPPLNDDISAINNNNSSSNNKSSTNTSNNVKNKNGIDERTTKVRRCFGNTMCMPQTLLCFKNTPELGTSPDGTFVQMHRKQSANITVNLLNSNRIENNNTSASSSLDDDKNNATIIINKLKTVA